MRLLIISRLAPLAVLGAFVSVAAGTTFNLVAPASMGSVEGDANLSFPFNIGQLGLASERYQQVFGAGEFGAVAAGGGFITTLTFRIDANPAIGSSFTSTLPDIQLNMSTTAKPVDGLSSVFAENVGADDSQVYARGSLSLSGVTGFSPNPFNVVINLTTPFFYNPANGNLLLDVRNYGGGATTAFNATSGSSDNISRVYTTFGATVDSPTANGTTRTSYGLITQFTFEVPEPSSVTLGALGLVVLLGTRRRKRAGAGRS